MLDKPKKSDQPTRVAIAALIDQLGKGDSLPLALDRCTSRYSRRDVDLPTKRALERMKMGLKKNPNAVPSRQEAEALRIDNESEKIRYARQTAGRTPGTVSSKAVNAAATLATVLGVTYPESCALIRAMAASD